MFNSVQVLDHEYTWSAALGCYVSLSTSLLPEEAKRPVREGLARSSRARIAATESTAQDKGKGKAREASPAPVPVEPPKKRGPGRPRKHPLPVLKPEPVESTIEFEAPKVKRGPGRPKKVVKPVVTDEPEVVRIGW